MKRRPLTASRLRFILSISLFVIIAIGALIAAFAYTELKRTAVETSHTTADANASQDNLQNLLKIQQKLTSEEDVIARTNSIVADSQSYQYQDQIIADLKDYANKAGLSITNIDFASNTQNGTSPPTNKSATPTPTGVKTSTVSVTLKNPVDYLKLLRFLKSIEQNLTKMQVSKINLTKGTGSDVTSEALTIEVYIK